MGGNLDQVQEKLTLTLQEVLEIDKLWRSVIQKEKGL